jgi:hypothetical protein
MWSSQSLAERLVTVPDELTIASVARFRALRADRSTPELLGAESEQGSRPGEAGLMEALACGLPDQRRRSARF